MATTYPMFLFGMRRMYEQDNYPKIVCTVHAVEVSMGGEQSTPVINVIPKMI